MFATFEDVESLLAGKGLFHLDLSLGRMRRGVAALPAPAYLGVQVLGTNGKGSTCAFLASLAKAHGMKTGLYLSPHFVSPQERIMINGKAAAKEEWLEAANELAALMPDALADLTYFEFLTLLAALLFQRAGVELAIFEAGLGGRHDATTALGAQICCFTPIAMDHAALLGPGLTDIAANKADAMRADAPAFSARQYPLAAVVLKKTAAARGAKLRFADPLRQGAELGLAGAMQLDNGGLALACWRACAGLAGRQSDAALEKAGLAAAFIPGRMQMVSEPARAAPLLLDGAHNPHAMQALMRQLPFAPRTIIFSALADKNWPDALAMLMARAPKASFLAPQLGNERAAEATAIAAFIEQRLPGRAQVFEPPDSMARALAAARGPALICGSLYLLAEFYRLYPQFLQKDQI